MDTDHPVKKVVLTPLGQRGVVAVSAEGCDPYVRVCDFGRPREPAEALAELLALAPETVVQAQATWQEQPRHPAYQSTTPAAPATTRPKPKPASPRRAGATQPAAQPQGSLFDLLPAQQAHQEGQT